MRSLPVGPQYTQRTTKPGYDHTDRSSTLNSSDLRGTSYELTAPTPNVLRPPTVELAKMHNPQSSLGSGKSKAGTSQLSVAAPAVAKLEQPSHARPSSRGLEEPRVVNGSWAPEFPPLPDIQDEALPTHPHSGPPHSPPLMPSRRPTTTPVLLPEYRYCSRCQIVKPSRTHHCRACGTVSCFFCLSVCTSP